MITYTGIRTGGRSRVIIEDQSGSQWSLYRNGPLPGRWWWRTAQDRAELASVLLWSHFCEHDRLTEARRMFGRTLTPATLARELCERAGGLLLTGLGDRWTLTCEQIDSALETIYQERRHNVPTVRP